MDSRATEFNSVVADPSSGAPSLSALQEDAMASATAGDLRNAVQVGAQLLAALTETAGEHHPDTLIVAVLLAGWRYNIGDVSTALTTVRELIPPATQVLGWDHPSTLAARHIFACGDSALGVTPAEALPVWVALYGDEQRVFGSEHHSTLGARHQIGELRRQLGDRIGARDELMAAAYGIRRTLGDQHPESLAVQLTAAVCLGEAGDAAAAVAEFDRLIPLLTAVLGYDHQHTLLARHTRALWLTPGGQDPLEQVSDWEVLVDDEMRALGEHNPLTITGRQTLQDQRTAWQHFLDDHQAQPGSAENTDEARYRLAELMNTVVQAKMLVAQATRQSGPESEASLTRRLELADLLRRGRRFDAARLRAEALAAECGAVLGEEHSVTQAAHSLLGVIDSSQS
jgi:hypothetical protein